MTRGYRELVGVQVTFSKVASTYSLTHYYRWKSGKEQSGVLSMRGYDMDRASTPEAIADSLRNAYAPVVLSIWKQDELASSAELLQFTVGARPDELGLPGTWTLWAEW